ncbi:hypothetical protein B4589_015390 (plasmid) [Halolamina sp. CBA1230]|uniref:hypothetical protein n=1 Tax=Halolamina sp. CBA1230 TaxID=1853690 RepID=UPI0009A1AA33|nr:hypothetical protein [Halolamina sp. CBA1230]QKY21807.1 hypothetical protein B4589_015390 [Halolamina sp. CBA1230]
MSRRTRRSTLAAVGAAVAGGLAGCSALRSSDEPAVEYDESALGALPGDLPEIPPTLPVQPTDAHVAAARDRVRSLLEGVDPSRIPNEVVRRRLTAEAESARAALDEDDDGPRADALTGLTHPRSEAMFASAGFAAFEGELTPADVETRRERHHRAAASFLDDHSPVGPPDDPVGALAQHLRITEWGQTGARLTEPQEHYEYENTVLHAAELAQGTEWGRAYAADARRLYDHYTSMLDDPRDYEDRFADVAATLVDDVAEHTTPPDWGALGSDLDRDVTDTAGEDLLQELARRRLTDAEQAVERHDGGHDAGAVVFAMRTLAADRAFEAARTAIEDGEYGVPESVDPIAAERAAAVDGLGTLLDTSPAMLARLLALLVANPIRNADRRVREDDVYDVGRSLYARYAVANRFAAAAPAVVRRVGDAVDG